MGYLWILSFFNRMVKITDTGPTVDCSVESEGTFVYAKVGDTCPECPENNLDLSLGAWDALTDDSAASEV